MGTGRVRADDVTREEGAEDPKKNKGNKSRRRWAGAAGAEMLPRMGQRAGAVGSLGGLAITVLGIHL